MDHLFEAADLHSDKGSVHCSHTLSENCFLGLNPSNRSFTGL